MADCQPSPQLPCPTGPTPAAQPVQQTHGSDRHSCNADLEVRPVSRHWQSTSCQHPTGARCSPDHTCRSAPGSPNRRPSQPAWGPHAASYTPHAPEHPPMTHVGPCTRASHAAAWCIAPCPHCTQDRNRHCNRATAQAPHEQPLGSVGLSSTLGHPAAPQVPQPH